MLPMEREMWTCREGVLELPLFLISPILREAWRTSRQQKYFKNIILNLKFKINWLIWTLLIHKSQYKVKFVLSSSESYLWMLLGSLKASFPFLLYSLNVPSKSSPLSSFISCIFGARNYSRVSLILLMFSALFCLFRCTILFEGF